MTELIAKHGGYQNLKSFQTTVIIYDLTVEFCRFFIPSHKMRDQLEGAARSGSQNIGEASQVSGTSKQTEIRLTDVARASLEELKLDMQAFLRQNNLPIWDKNHPKALEIRKLGYMTNRSYKTYMSYMTNKEYFANCLLCLINQAGFLLDQQLRTLSKDFTKQGDFKDRQRAIKKSAILNEGPSFEEFIKPFGWKRLENGQVVKITDEEK